MFNPQPEVEPKALEVLPKTDGTPEFPTTLGVDDELTIWLQTDCAAPEPEELAYIPIKEIRLS